MPPGFVRELKPGKLHPVIARSPAYLTTRSGGWRVRYEFVFSKGFNPDVNFAPGVVDHIEALLRLCCHREYKTLEWKGRGG